MTQNSPTIKCPYCESSISQSAQVCRSCGRDVIRLILAESKIKELEKKLENTDFKAAVISQEYPWVFRIPLWSFYALSTTSLMIFKLPSYYYEMLVAIMAFITGIIVMLRFRDCNIWILFLAGFAQPLIATLTLILLQKTSAAMLVDLIGAFFLVSVQIGFSTALGGMAIAFLTRRKTRVQQFSITPFFDWLSTAESRLDRIEKFILKISAIIAAGTLLISNFLSSVK